MFIIFLVMNVAQMFFDIQFTNDIQEFYDLYYFLKTEMPARSKFVRVHSELNWHKSFQL